MKRFRSQTDEQLAAQYDPAPYVYENGERTNVSQYTNSLAPRIECIPSRDPLPYVGSSGERYSRKRLPASTLRLSPRPEFARPDVNYILIELRSTGESAADYLREWDTNPDFRANIENDFDAEEAEFAYEVISRLARLADS